MEITLTCSYCGDKFSITVDNETNADNFRYQTVWCDNPSCWDRAEHDGMLDLSDNEAGNMLDNLGLF